MHHYLQNDSSRRLLQRLPRRRRGQCDGLYLGGSLARLISRHINGSARHSGISGKLFGGYQLNPTSPSKRDVRPRRVSTTTVPSSRTASTSMRGLLR